MSSLNIPEQAEAVLEAFHDFKTVYENNAEEFGRRWRSMGQQDRKDLFVKFTGPGTELNGHHVISPILWDFHIDNLTADGSDIFLDYMRFRSWGALVQVITETCGNTCDVVAINRALDAGIIPPKPDHDQPENGVVWYMKLVDEGTYGHLVLGCEFEIFENNMYRNLRIVRLNVGLYALERQLGILLFLRFMIEHVLRGDHDSTALVGDARAEDAGTASLAEIQNLSIDSTPKDVTKYTITELLFMAQDHQNEREEDFDLCRSEPVVLEYLTSLWFTSHTGRVHNNNKQIVFEVTSNKYISRCIFDMLLHTLAGVANWNYMTRLLRLLDRVGNDNISKRILQQELANAVSQEYARTQRHFKRYVQQGTGTKDFHRIDGQYEDGVHRVILKKKIGDEIRKVREASKKLDVETVRDNKAWHYHHMLFLCHATTGVADAVLSIKKATGSKLGFLFEDMVSDAATAVQSFCSRRKEDLAKNSKSDTQELVPEPLTAIKLILSRRQKSKSRPDQPSNYDLTARPAPLQEAIPVKLTVQPAAFAVFMTLFDRTQAQGAIAFRRFEAAMTSEAEVDFAMKQGKQGSAVNFIPGPKLQTKGIVIPSSFHKPHPFDVIEGILKFHYARKLRRSYGWDKDTFVLAEN